MSEDKKDGHPGSKRERIHPSFAFLFHWSLNWMDDAALIDKGDSLYQSIKLNATFFWKKPW